MPTKLERLDAKIEEARKAREKAEVKRDQAIKTLARSAAAIVANTRSIVRLDKQRRELLRAERASRNKPARAHEGDSIPVL